MYRFIYCGHSKSDLVFSSAIFIGEKCIDIYTCDQSNIQRQKVTIICLPMEAVFQSKSHTGWLMISLNTHETCGGQKGACAEHCVLLLLSWPTRLSEQTTCICTHWLCTSCHRYHMYCKRVHAHSLWRVYRRALSLSPVSACVVLVGRD